MTWWRFRYSTWTATWQKFGCIAFVEAEHETEARALGIAAAKAEFGGCDIIEIDLVRSTSEAAAAFAEKQRRMSEWLENTRTGKPNLRGQL